MGMSREVSVRLILMILGELCGIALGLLCPVNISTFAKSEAIRLSRMSFTSTLRELTHGLYAELDQRLKEKA